ncbi:MAG: hypothetical protein KUG77_05240 [Nannocystaceae bacterium]|nr:hypothetical protein [Nannocystaceae bacterium]
MLLSVVAGCADFGAFGCDEAADCDARAGGRCEASRWCSYDDASCDSARRYGPYAGDGLADACLETDAPTSTGDTGSTGSSETDPTGECDAESCSGLGTCVEVDAVATCACDEGTYREGLACLEDPCTPGATCLFVDAEAGSDDDDGSRERPWQTLAPLQSAALQPGTFVLLRRDRTYASPAELSDIFATLEAPVTLGAWGPRNAAKPVLNAGLVVSDAAGLVLRDLELSNPGGPCLQVERTDGVVGRSLTIHDCAGEGIAVLDGSQHTVWMDNVVNATQSTGIAVRDVVRSVDGVDTDIFVGPHHYILDNELSGTQGVFVRLRGPGSDGDVKLLGNTLLASTFSGLSSLQRVGWVVGNTVGGLPDGAGLTGRPHSLLIDLSATQQIAGNVFFDSGLGAEVDLSTLGVLERNTFAFMAPDTSVTRPMRLQASTTPQRLVIRGNLFLTSVDEQISTEPGALLTDIDNNAFVPQSGTCAFDEGGDVLSFEAWQALGRDLASTCGPIPGVTGDLLAGTDPAALEAEGFFAPLVPAPGWEGCELGVGAFDCSGTRHSAPLLDLGLADDWDGILEVWQRYAREG